MGSLVLLARRSAGVPASITFGGVEVGDGTFMTDGKLFIEDYQVDHVSFVEDHG